MEYGLGRAPYNAPIAYREMRETVLSMQPFVIWFGILRLSSVGQNYALSLDPVFLC